MSDDGAVALVVIALVGSPFSARYAEARAQARASGQPMPNALDYAALNVALYSEGRRVWSFNERALDPSDRRLDGVSFGRSTVSSRGGELVVRLDERETPFGALGRVPRTSRPVRGVVRFVPERDGGAVTALDELGEHAWWPVAPLGTVIAELSEPSISFRGAAYHDVNFGRVPLEATFSGWSWARGTAADGRAIVSYSAALKGGGTSQLALAFDARGPSPIEAVTHELSPSRWRLARTVDAPEGTAPRVVRSLEDGPFYARSLLSAHVGGAPMTMVHETLSCERWEKAWVRGLSTFRTGRAA